MNNEVRRRFGTLHNKACIYCCNNQIHDNSLSLPPNSEVAELAPAWFKVISFMNFNWRRLVKNFFNLLIRKSMPYLKSNYIAI